MNMSVSGVDGSVMHTADTCDGLNTCNHTQIRCNMDQDSQWTAGTFLDLIHPDCMHVRYKQWVPGTYMDTLDVAGLLKEPFHVTFKEYTALLSPLYGMCTHELLHQARKERYGEGYAEFPTDKPGSLVSLCHIGHVPNDTHQTRAFEGHVRRFTQWLVDRYWSTEHRPHWYIGYSVKPMGSFPCDTKVGDIDEFDYLCVLEVPTKWWTLTKGTGSVSVPGGTRLNWDFHAHCRDLLYPLTSSTGDEHLPQVRNVNKHGNFATCIDLAWTCRSGHAHEMGLDISLATEVGDREVGEVINGHIHGLPSPFHGVEKHVNQHVFVYTLQTYSWHLSSCFYDNPLFDVLTRSLSQNMRMLFICLKLLTKGILPKEMKVDWKGLTGYKAGDTLSSHALKCLLFEEVIRHSDPSDWQGERMVDRLVGVLTTLSTTYRIGTTNTHDTTQTDHAKDTWGGCRDVITRSFIPSKSDAHLIDTPPTVLTNMSALAEFMMNDTGFYLTTEVDAEQTENMVYLKSPDGLLHAAHISKDVVFPFDDTHIYGYSCDVSSPYQTHPLMEWCRRHIKGLYHTHQGVDLTRVPTDDFHILWGLVYVGTLNKAVFNTDIYKDKLAKLRYYMDKYADIPTGGSLWERLIYGHGYEQPSGDVMTYLSHAPLEHLEAILECGMYEMSAMDQRGKTYSEIAAANSIQQMAILKQLGERADVFVDFWTDEVGYIREMMSVYLAIDFILKYHVK